MSSSTIAESSPPGSYLSNEQVLEMIREACPPSEFRGKKVLLIVPDGTRTCPLGMLFKVYPEQQRVRILQVWEF